MCYSVVMARTRVDLLPVTLRELRVSAFHRVWIKVGLGVHLRARVTPEGFDLRIRYGKDDVIQKSKVRVRETEVGTNGVLRPFLICAGCGKVASKNLYLGVDFQWRCAKCLGVKPWKVRTPMKWDLGEEVKFRQLLRRKVDQDILAFEIEALRTLTPEEFFASRPYLVPEFVEDVKTLNPGLHKKLLKTLHGKYKSVMMKRRVRMINEKETTWLMEKLSVVFEKAFIITKKDIEWLRSRGSHSSLKLELSGSQPSETDCSSQKTSSDQDTSAEGAEEQDALNAINARG